MTRLDWLRRETREIRKDERLRQHREMLATCDRIIASASAPKTARSQASPRLRTTR